MICGRPVFPGSNVEEELLLIFKVQIPTLEFRSDELLMLPAKFIARSREQILKCTAPFQQSILLCCYIFY